MASNRMQRREDKRTKLVKKYISKRQELKKQLNDPSLDLEQKYKVLAEFEKLPRDSASVRQTRRCSITGRSHGVYRKFGLGRNELRRTVMKGEAPGTVKSSW